MDAPELHVRTTGPDATRAVAELVAGHLVAGDVVSLSGELGAGKTCFVQGAAAGLGVEVAVTSPTFVLVRLLAGRLPVVHCDVYRLDRLGDVLELGDEVLAPDVITFVEWGDAIAPLLPDDRLDVELRLDGVPPEATDAPDAANAEEAADEPVAADEPEAADEPDRTIVVRLLGHTRTRLDALTADLRAAGHAPELAG